MKRIAFVCNICKKAHYTEDSVKKVSEWEFNCKDKGSCTAKLKKGLNYFSYILKN